MIYYETSKLRKGLQTVFSTSILNLLGEHDLPCFHEIQRYSIIIKYWKLDKLLKQFVHLSNALEGIKKTKNKPKKQRKNKPFPVIKSKPELFYSNPQSSYYKCDAAIDHGSEMGCSSICIAFTSPDTFSRALDLHSASFLYLVSSSKNLKISKNSLFLNCFFSFTMEFTIKLKSGIRSLKSRKKTVNWIMALWIKDFVKHSRNFYINLIWWTQFSWKIAIRL